VACWLNSIDTTFELNHAIFLFLCFAR